MGKPSFLQRMGRLREKQAGGGVSSVKTLYGALNVALKERPKD